MVHSFSAERLHLGEPTISLWPVGDTFSFYTPLAIALLFESKASRCPGKK
jgi:hypothetical protein